MQNPFDYRAFSATVITAAVIAIVFRAAAWAQNAPLTALLAGTAFLIIYAFWMWRLSK
jgi:uncharacterized membrane protein YozB (DUF420 family)